MRDRIWKAAASAAALLALEEQVCSRGSREAEGGGISGNVDLGHQPLHCYRFLLETLPPGGPSSRGWAEFSLGAPQLLPLLIYHLLLLLVLFAVLWLCFCLFLLLVSQCLDHEHCVGLQAGVRGMTTAGWAECCLPWHR